MQVEKALEKHWSAGMCRPCWEKKARARFPCKSKVGKVELEFAGLEGQQIGISF